MRVSTGVDGIDRLIDGGLPAGRLYVISGPPGSGKTTLTSQFLTEGARQQDNCLFISMHEKRSELVEDMSTFEFPFEKVVDSEYVNFIDATDRDINALLSKFGGGSHQSGVESLGNYIVGFIDSNDIDRVVIDSTMILEYLLGDESGSDLTRFLTSLKRIDATILLISEMTDPTAYSNEHYLAHGVIFMHNYLQESGMTRGVQVLKMRGTSIDTDIHPVEFTSRGLSVDPNRTVTR